MSSVCYVLGLLCLGFVMFSVCFLVLVCIVFVCLGFVCLGFVMSRVCLSRVGYGTIALFQSNCFPGKNINRRLSKPIFAQMKSF